jgi:hypothetical protein
MRPLVWLATTMAWLTGSAFSETPNSEWLHLGVALFSVPKQTVGNAENYGG